MPLCGWCHHQRLMRDSHCDFRFICPFQFNWFVWWIRNAKFCIKMFWFLWLTKKDIPENTHARARCNVLIIEFQAIKVWTYSAQSLFDLLRIYLMFVCSAHIRFFAVSILSPIPKRKTNSISLCSQASDQLLANKITHSRTNTHKCITSKCDYMQQITEEWKYISFVLSLWFLFFFVSRYINTHIRCTCLSAVHVSMCVCVYYY